MAQTSGGHTAITLKTHKVVWDSGNRVVVPSPVHVVAIIYRVTHCSKRLTSELPALS